MTALTKDRLTDMRVGNQFEYPSAAAVKSYTGALICLDSAGNAKPGVTGTGLKAVGRCEELADNSSGAAAAINVKVRAGVFRWGNGDSIDKINIGDTAYIVDDQTVSKANASQSAAGIIVDVDSVGVWVDTKPESVLGSTGLLAANNLSDVGSVATARSNLGLDTGDSPTFAGLTSSAAINASAGVAHGPATTAIMKSKKTTLTAAQIKALATTQITLVAAVAGKYMEFLGAVFVYNYGSEVLVEPSDPDDLEIKMVDAAGVTVSDTIEATALLTAAGDRYANAAAINVAGGALADRVNVPLILDNTGTDYTGNASDDATLDVIVSYIEYTV